MSNDDQADRAALLAAYTDDADNVAKPMTHPAAYAACDCLTGHQHMLAVRAAHEQAVQVPQEGQDAGRPSERRTAEAADAKELRAERDAAVARAEKAEATVARVAELADLLIEQGEHHPPGCRGQADCAACVHADLTAALDGPHE